MADEILPTCEATDAYDASNQFDQSDLEAMNAAPDDLGPLLGILDPQLVEAK